MKDEGTSALVAAARAAGSLLLAWLLLLAPLALAHEGFDAGAPLGEGSLHVRVVGAPLLVAGAPLRVEARTDLPLPLEARLVPPAGAPGAWFPLRDEGAWRAAHIAFVEPGPWQVEVRAGADVARFDVVVWPAGRAFVEPEGEDAERGVVVAGEPARLTFRLVDADHRPLAPPSDARALVRCPEGEEEAPLAARDGLLLLERAWRAPGVREVEVVSREAGLGPGMRPPLRVLVVPPEEADVYGLAPRETPWGPVALAALAVAALALRLTRARP